MKCLVVEDDEVYREKVSRCIGDEFDLTFAIDAEQALARIEELPFDCAVVDFKIPKGNGLQVLEKLVAKDVPTVFVTSLGSEEVAVAALKVGAEDYIVKGSPLYNNISLPLRQAMKQAENRKIILTRDRAKDEVIAELREALRKVEILEGLLPVCSWCKSVRDDNGYWKNLESYLANHTRLEITHGVCPDCLQKVVEEMKDL